ncbi:MAG TPA: N-acetylmuramoyl-L-alanine amidase [Flavobacteriales bacterium]|nr:N-acetylmuramoyl-L-alanine amidase [Flavobacteriales bacterium]HIO71494.1 N-acetylmuramoyl-L-alanine amidase [Flavobacteriales bacterium]
MWRILLLTFGLFFISASLLDEPRTYTFPIFGKNHEKVTIVDSKLKNCVYYIVSGHGGPDPGATGTAGGRTVCEDEYAYDVALRLAKRLLAHDAMAYMITRDPDDGIRSEEYLDCDKDDYCWKDQKIPASQSARLQQRCAAVNSLYRKHLKGGAKSQILIILHIDSRSTKERVDMFFYHDKKSKSGKAIAQQLRETIKVKYDQYQENRGYEGKVSSRKLHVLNKSLPAAVYIELGNIRNMKDQKRFIVESNRQAVADWIADGLLNYSR